MGAAYVTQGGSLTALSVRANSSKYSGDSPKPPRAGLSRPTSPTWSDFRSTFADVDAPRSNVRIAKAPQSFSFLTGIFILPAMSS